jgi:phage protein U
MATATINTLPQDPTRPQGAVSQHALLGDIRFSLVTYFEGMELKFAADYAEHALIKGKPMLQWTGDKLDEVSWDIVLHAGYCDPEAEMLKLRQAVRDHKALPLVFANGDYKGYFVPTEASVSSKKLHADGGAVWMEVKLSLRECVVPPSLVEATPVKPAAAAEKPANGKPTKPAKTVKKKPAQRPPGRCTRNSV